MKARVAPLVGPLRGASVRVPGDKSVSHRALLFAALAEGESRIAGLAPGGDVRSTARCLAQLGVPLLRGDGTPWSAQAPARPPGALALPEPDPDMGPDDAIVLGVGLQGLRAPVAALDCGNSGTTLRLLCGILAGAGVPATLVGDHSLTKRPMERVAAPLRSMGALLDTTGRGTPPVHVRSGGTLHAAAIRSQVASAQVKSAVLLAGLFTDGETSFTEPARSRDHTERLLRAMGVPLTVRGTTVSVRGRARLEPFALDIPGDLSSAAFLLAAALAGPAGSSVELVHVGVNPTRAGFLDALACFGARLQLSVAGGLQGAAGHGLAGSMAARPLDPVGLGADDAGAGPARGAAEAPSVFGGAGLGEPTARLTISAQPLRGAELDGELVLRAIDEVPILAVLGALAAGTTIIRGAAELRVKESDRLAQMAQGLRAMGAAVEELPDGLRIEGVGGTGRRLVGATIDAAGDHRIALAFTIAALSASSPSTLSGAEWADVSFPGFFDLLQHLGASVELSPD